MGGNYSQKKRRAPWLLGAFVLFLLISLILLQSSNLWKDFSIETASDTLFLYALSSLNFIAFVIFGFILIRNLLKLQRERRALLLGSRIKTRLLFYFFSLSLLPIIAMAIFSYLFLNRAIEHWFAQIPENTIREAQQIYDASIAERRQRLRDAAQILTTTLEGQKIDDELLSRLVEQGDFSYIGVLNKQNEVLIEKEASFLKDDAISQQLIADSRAKILSGENISAESIYASAQFRDGRRLVVIPKEAVKVNVGSVASKSLQEFDRLKQRQVTVRRIGLSTIGLLTLLLVFASSWAAFYLARGLTLPVKALAEGADEIARGNFSHRVDVFAEDELALLVTAFNGMSSRLEANSSELLERRRYIETILESLSAGVISFNSENKVTTINRAAVRMLRLEDGDFQNFSLDQLLGEENCGSVEKLIRRARRAGHATEQTLLLRENTDRAKSGTESIPVALGATSLPKDSNGNSAGVVLVIEDLSELLIAQRAAAWQEVARRMAHEIKNPLTPIQLSAERIAKRFNDLEGSVNGDSRPGTATVNERRHDGRSADVIKEGTETILREVSSLKAMVDEFSRFARLPDVKLESRDLNDVILQSVALYEDRFDDISIKTSLADDLPRGLIDEEQLKRVFVNLIDNSVEAFSDSQAVKRVEITSAFDTSRDVLVATVTDNGSGFAPQNLSKLFQPYFSTKGRGTGLGLAIVERIINEHHGKVSAASVKPTGARFVLEIPTAA